MIRKPPFRYQPYTLIAAYYYFNSKSGFVFFIGHASHHYLVGPVLLNKLTDIGQTLLANSLENYYKFAKDSLPKDIGS